MSKLDAMIEKVVADHVANGRMELVDAETVRITEKGRRYLAIEKAKKSAGGTA